MNDTITPAKQKQTFHCPACGFKADAEVSKDDKRFACRCQKCGTKFTLSFADPYDEQVRYYLLALDYDE